MEYIRHAKAQPTYPPDTRHCLYGLDADLIMLSLLSHEPHFALLREVVTFGRPQGQKSKADRLHKRDSFQVLYVSLLREYMDLEFRAALDGKLKFAYNFEQVIDDRCSASCSLGRRPEDSADLKVKSQGVPKDAPNRLWSKKTILGRCEQRARPKSSPRGG